MATALEKLEKWIKEKGLIKNNVMHRVCEKLYIVLMFKLNGENCSILDGIECESINISHNNLSGHCDKLQRIKCRSLIMSLCKISDDDCKWIKDIKCNDLDVSMNNIGDDGIKLLTDNIYSKLNISNNDRITDIGSGILKNMKCRRLRFGSVIMLATNVKTIEIEKSARKNWYVWSMNEWNMTDVIKAMIADYCCGCHIRNPISNEPKSNIYVGIQMISPRPEMITSRSRDVYALD
jgi:hypothetical protein